MARAVLHVQGMHCASCVSHVEKALRAVPGVTDAAVNLATERASVSFDGAGVTPGSLAEAVRGAGYGAEAVSVAGGLEAQTGHLHADSGADEAAIWRRRALVGAALGLPVVVLGMFVPGRESGVVQLVLTVLIQAYIGRAYYLGAWNAARHGRADMDTLVALGTTAALGYSVYTLARGEHHFYFDTAAVILVLIAGGKWMEARARGQASRAITALLNLRPPVATVVRNGAEIEISTDQLRRGDLVVVRPGGAVPADGRITDGTAVVDESMVTGEAMPVEKGPGQLVVGGTQNLTGSFRYEVTRVGAESLLGQILELVDRAQASKAGIQRLADAVAGVFVPIVIVIAAATLVGWGVWGDWSVAVRAAIAVLIVACPCALGLATPAAIMVGTGIGARSGILIKNAGVLERIGRLGAIVLDKTGTLTEGRPRVTDIVMLDPGMDRGAAIRLAAGAEAPSEHPIARAIVESASADGQMIPAATKFRSITGGGVRAEVDGRSITVAKPDRASLPPGLAELEKQGKTVVVLSEADGATLRPLALIALGDSLRPGASGAVKQLRELGLRVVLMTGDNRAAADEVARRCGIDEVHAGVLPQDKETQVRALGAAGHGVAMVGDGINDAPALAAADIGIAMGTGTDIAKDAGDIVIVSGDLGLVPASIRLSRAMIRRIRLGLFWAFAYNAVLIPVAAAGLLHPMLAAGAMGLSSVSVVANALLLKGFRMVPIGKAAARSDSPGGRGYPSARGA